MKPELWSDRLAAWLAGDHPKTIAGLRENFGREALMLGILMAIPALPLPTGGITHLFEIIAFVLCLEFVAGERLWLPKRWLHRPLPRGVRRQVLPRLIAGVRWYERYMRPWGGWAVRARSGRVLWGAALCVCIIAAFVAPPFSGLDTLPALGAVILCLALLVQDVRLALTGCVVGAAGISLIVFLGAFAWAALRSFI
ncbi:MAG TPA: exopolysaccharide biosynthesis protein [Candidatus Saccharimonadales bacterium]|nr:exopolysaccharide biosynthesis protein [Candidatus Saccharimonadales bacterium]